MKNKALVKATVTVLFLITILSLVPAEAYTPGDTVDNPLCFAQFEACINKVRVKFWGALFDFLDCELQLASCIVHVIK